MPPDASNVTSPINGYVNIGQIEKNGGLNKTLGFSLSMGSHPVDPLEVSLNIYWGPTYHVGPLFLCKNIEALKIQILGWEPIGYLAPNCCCILDIEKITISTCNFGRFFVPVQNLVGQCHQGQQGQCSYSYGGWMYFTLFRGILMMFWELSRLLLSKYVLVNPALAEQPSKAIYDFHFVRSVYNY